ncbi:hypothetical protein CK203_085923 [Vitis vinifera]|uniref:Uncharacterized protein n=1 Tax=Vitis vinifera TaxID=29760 RepID=A0A438DI15_VITVI|nr:hypothetical protein CK203_085923 [Vitis vinifera]
MPLDRAFERLRSTGFLASLVPRPSPSILPPRFRAHEFCAFHQMAGHLTDYCAFLRHTIQDLIDSGAFLILRAYTIMFWTPRALIFTGHFDTLLVYFGTTLVLDSFSVVTGPRAEIDGMMVMIFSEYIEIRLLQLRFTMSDEIAPITLTTLYEMMVDLTPRVERIELILSEYPSSSRGTPGVAMPSLPYLTPSMFATLGHEILAPLAPRALPDPMPPQFRLDLYCMYHQSVGHHTDHFTALRHAIQDIVDSGTFGHPQSDMFPIPTSA